MMKTKVVCLGALAIAALMVACSGPAPEEFTAKDGGSIRQETDALTASFNAKELPKILDLYVESSVFMPPNEPIIRGKDALKNFYEDLLTKKGASNLKLDVTEVSGHGPIAYETGTYEMELKPAAGPQGHDRGKFLFVVRKMGAGWRFQHMMWNSDLPPAGV